MRAELTFDGGDLTPTELVNALDDLEGSAGEHLETAAQEIAFEIEGDATENAPVGVSGNLQSSLRSTVDSVGETLLEIHVGSTANYAAAVEKGTDPHFPPPSALRDWARSVLGDEDLAYPVARSIAENGTEAQPFLEPAFEDNLTFIVDRINDAVEQAIQEALFS